MFKAVIFCLMTTFSLLAVESPFLRVGTNAEFPPFTFKEGNTIVGFDIDIAKEVCKRLNMEIKFKDVPFEALIPDLLLGSVDFVAAGMSITEERARRVNFSKPYLSGDPLVLLTPIDKKATLKELNGKVIVVNEGYTADSFISSKTGYTILRLISPSDAFLALQTGKAEGLVIAKSSVEAFFSDQDSEKFHMEALDTTAENCALVFSKKKIKLLEEVQGVLDEMEKDGTILEYKIKWKLS